MELARKRVESAQRAYRQDLTRAQNLQGRVIEVLDSDIPTYRLNPPPSNANVPDGPKDGYIVLDQVIFSDDPNPPAVDLSRTGFYDPGEFWEPIKRPSRDSSMDRRQPRARSAPT